MTMDIRDVLQRGFSISIDYSNIDIQRMTFENGGVLVPKPFPGFRNSSLSGPYKCSLSHISIIKMAISMDLPNVIIYEDDAYPRISATEIISSYLSNVPDDFDVIILGWSKLKSPQNTEFKRFKRFQKGKTVVYGSHAYIISKNAYWKVMNKYESSDKTVADDLYKFADNVYITDIPMFIQFSRKKTMNGHSGYIFEGDHESPPKGFPDIHEIIINKKFDINPVKMEKYSKKYNFPSGNTCMVIGSNPSIKNFEFGDAIDNSDIFTFRINRIPDQSIAKNCGNRTDVFLGCTFHKQLLSKVSNKVIFEDSAILDISRDFFVDKRWFTTGFIGILFALYNFKKVYLYGFGNPYEDEDYSSEKHVYSNVPLIPKNHSLKFEHAIIKKFRDVNYKERLFIVEAGDSFT